MWGGRWEGGSCLGTHVRIKDFKIKKKPNYVCISFNKASLIHFSSPLSLLLLLHHWQSFQSQRKAPLKE